MIFRELQEQDIDLIKKWLQAPHVAEWFKHPVAWIEEIEQRKTKSGYCFDRANDLFIYEYEYKYRMKERDRDIVINVVR